MSENTSGTLFVVGTPIGNLGDLSPRARDALASVQLVVAEDTRRSRQLLASIAVDLPLISYHDHNERQRTPELLAKLRAGAFSALVSDAGMPLVSDPGWRLVRAALDASLTVSCIPGPSAVTAALAVSGLPAERFVFEGFLPRRTGPRRERLAALRGETRTIVILESPQRVAESLRELAEALGPERPAALARELTKVYESVYRGTLGHLFERVGSEIPARGEFVIVVGGGELSPDIAAAERIYALLAAELPPSQALALAAQITGAARNELYRRLRLPAASASPEEPVP